MKRSLLGWVSLALFAAGCAAEAPGGATNVTTEGQGASSSPARELADGELPQTDGEWRQRLTEEQFCVTREKGTERAFQNAYWDHKEDGVYRCVCCGQTLFDSAAKYDSGTGWPSFWQPLEQSRVATKADKTWRVTRTEVLCGRCDAHLGHVFKDGPEPTGLRYCVNSAALSFEGRTNSTPKDSTPKGSVSKESGSEEMPLK